MALYVALYSMVFTTAEEAEVALDFQEPITTILGGVNSVDPRLATRGLASARLVQTCLQLSEEGVRGTVGPVREAPNSRHFTNASREVQVSLFFQSSVVMGVFGNRISRAFFQFTRDSKTPDDPFVSAPRILVNFPELLFYVFFGKET